MSLARFSILFIALAFLLCGKMNAIGQSVVPLPGQTGQKSGFPSADTWKHAKISFQLIPGINSTWGYDILVEGRLTIHQPSVPSLPGNEGFKTKDGAEKIAKLVIKKMKKGEMPPTIDAEEIKKLKAI